MAVYLPKAREQSTSHLQVSSDSRNLAAVSRINSSAMETFISMRTKAHLAHRGEFVLVGKKLHVDLCGRQLPTVLSHKMKPSPDVYRAPPKPTVCEKDNLK